MMQAGYLHYPHFIFTDTPYGRCVVSAYMEARTGEIKAVCPKVTTGHAMAKKVPSPALLPKPQDIYLSFLRKPQLL